MGWGRVAQILAELLKALVDAVQLARSRTRRDTVMSDGSGNFVRAFGKPEADKAGAGELDRDA